MKNKAKRKSSSKKSKLKASDDNVQKKDLRSTQLLHCNMSSDCDLRFEIWAVTNQIGEAVIFTRGLRAYGLFDQIAIGVQKNLVQDVSEVIKVITRLREDERASNILFVPCRSLGPAIQCRGLFLRLHYAKMDERRFLKKRFDINASERMVILLPRFAGASTWGGLPDAPEGFDEVRNSLPLNHHLVYRHLCSWTDNPLNKRCKIKIQCPSCELKSLPQLMTLSENECTITNCVTCLFEGIKFECDCGEPYNIVSRKDLGFSLVQEHFDYLIEHKKFFNAFTIIAPKGKNVQELLAAFGKGMTKETIDSSCVDGVDALLNGESYFSLPTDEKPTIIEEKMPKTIQQQKKRPQKTARIEYSTCKENTNEKARLEHSKRLGQVHDEAHSLFKNIRIKIANNTLKREPKKSSKKCTAVQPEAPSSISNPESIGFSGKAGKVSFLVRVGEEGALYKSTKPRSGREALTIPVRCSIDLHGYTVEDGRATLDKYLPGWYRLAMESEHPFVIEVKIICGGGAQLLSEMVEKWIRSHMVVAKAFE